MHILLTNDDGIYAKGIEVVKECLEGLGHRVTIVAPLEEMSGASLGVTFRSPVRVQKVRRNGTFFGYGVSGTPVDCVKLALKVLLEEKPDWVVSGLNNGYNYGLNVFYSGTVAGAVEGALQGIPSVALSTKRQKDPANLALLAPTVSEVMAWLFEEDWPKTPLLNVNFPPEKALGVRITRQSTAPMDERYQTTPAPSGEPFFWLYGSFEEVQEDLQFDDWSVLQGYVSITPLEIERTDYALKAHLERSQQRRPI